MTTSKTGPASPINTKTPESQLGHRPRGITPKHTHTNTKRLQCGFLSERGQHDSRDIERRPQHTFASGSSKCRSPDSRSDGRVHPIATIIAGHVLEGERGRELQADVWGHVLVDGRLDELVEAEAEVEV